MRSDNRNNDFIYLLIHSLLMMLCKVRFYGMILSIYTRQIGLGLVEGGKEGHFWYN